MERVKFVYLFVVLLFLPQILKAGTDNKIKYFVQVAQEEEVVPQPVINNVIARINNSVTSIGFSSSSIDDADFLIEVKFTGTQSTNIANPMPQVVVKTFLSISIEHIIEKKMFASTSLELKGVGGSMQQALNSSLSKINANNALLKGFVEESSTEIVDYYNKNYKKIIANADRSVAVENYGEALVLLTSIPDFIKNYDDVNEKIISAYHKYIDKNGKELVIKARNAWAINPTMSGAQEAVVYMNQVSPSCESYADMVKLYEEIKKAIKKEINWEQRVESPEGLDGDLDSNLVLSAARAIGVALR